MKLKQIALLIMAVAGGMAAWFFISPIFIDKTVDEPLLLTPIETSMPTHSEFKQMAPEMRQQTMQKIMAEFAAKPDQVMAESMMAEVAPQVLKRGAFRDADAVHYGSGDALLYRLTDGSHVLRLENFKVLNGPSLVVYLAKHHDPTQASDIEQGFLNLGDLKGNVGNQNYIIPAGVDVSEFNSAVIWCELFDVLFSPAALAVP